MPAQLKTIMKLFVLSALMPCRRARARTYTQLQTQAPAQALLCLFRLNFIVTIGCYRCRITQMWIFRIDSNWIGTDFYRFYSPIFNKEWPLMYAICSNSTIEIHLYILIIPFLLLFYAIWIGYNAMHTCSMASSYFIPFCVCVMLFNLFLFHSLQFVRNNWIVRYIVHSFV